MARSSEMSSISGIKVTKFERRGGRERRQQAARLYTARANERDLRRADDRETV